MAAMNGSASHAGRNAFVAATRPEYVQLIWN